MPIWGWIAAAYAVVMTTLAVVGYAKRRYQAIVTSILYGFASVNFALIESTTAQLILPAGMTLAGYWMSGLFIGPPQRWLESRLLESDHRLFSRLDINRVLEALPVWLLEASEFIYSTVYLVVMAGALLLAPLGQDALLHYWSVVLPSELICCAALPFLRSRPPRSLEEPGVIARRAPEMRRLNDVIVKRGSIQVNTIPSAHVASALAAGLAVGSWLPGAGAALVIMAILIATAAIVGRYHYAVDCLLGAAVAGGVWMITRGV
jgi:hypothetical protein